MAKRSPDYVSNMLAHFAKVLQWWQTKPGGSHPSFVEGLKWLANLRSQVMPWLLCNDLLLYYLLL